MSKNDAGDTQPKRRRKWKRWIIVAAVLFIAGSIGAVELTSTARFCNSCHIMNPYYTSWQEDVHSEIQCVECHIPPGPTNFVHAKLNGLGQVVDDWLNRTSTKPSASVSDMSCGREGCHDVEELKAKETKTDKFIFKHGKHLGREYRGIEIHCTTCHSHVRGENHFEVNTNVCVTCHLTANGEGLIVKAPDNRETVEQLAARTELDADAPWHEGTTAPHDCAKCHIAPRQPFMYQGLEVDHMEYLQYGASCDSCHHGVTAPPQMIDDAQCLGCHVFGVEKVESTETVHKLHTEGEHKVECFSCHGVTRHGPLAESMSLNKVDCYNCHAGQHEVQKATYLTRNLPETEEVVQQTAISPMFLVHVDCTGCHVEPDALKINPDSGATVRRAVPEACDNCHQAGLGEQMVPLWQRNTQKLYDQAAELLPGEDTPWNAGCPEAQEKIDEANRLLELVRLDGSWGVHNPLYTQRLLEQAMESILAARDICREKNVGGGAP